MTLKVWFGYEATKTMISETFSLDDAFLIEDFIEFMMQSHAVMGTVQRGLLQSAQFSHFVKPQDSSTSRVWTVRRCRDLTQISSVSFVPCVSVCVCCVSVYMCVCVWLCVYMCVCVVCVYVHCVYKCIRVWCVCKCLCVRGMVCVVCGCGMMCVCVYAVYM